MNTNSSQPVALNQANQERIFFQSTPKGDNNGWFISLTSERAYGPFPEREVAEYILEGLIKRVAARRQQKSVDQSSTNVA